MKFAAVLSAYLLAAALPAAAQQQAPARPSGPIQQKIAPGLAAYTDEILYGEVWPGAGLSPRDRSLVVISALIATNKPEQLQGHLGRGFNNGLTPKETSGILTHLALYAGWPSAVSALGVYDRVYTERKVDLAALQAAVSALPRTSPNTAAAEATLEPVGTVAPRFADLTNRVVFDDLWRRSDLSVRDRSLVTIAALAAMGDEDLLEPYLRRGAEAGLSRDQAGGALTHVAFYGGWGKAAEALAVLNRTYGASQASGDPGRPATSGGTRVSRKGAGPITTGSASNFIGRVEVMSPFKGTGGSRLGGATVRFQPGARSAWHRHPLGQLLVVTEGCGLTQAEGGSIEKICAGDVSWIGPGEKHWHGATRTSAMSHVAASESVEGQNVEWLEQVSDEEYARGPR